MSERVTHDELMRYLDGEVDAQERTRIEVGLAASTELRRELAVYRAMKDDLQTIKLTGGNRNGSVWHAVHRQLTRPLAWILLIVGSLIWAAYGVYLFFTSSAFLVEKLATAAIGIGILLLLATVIGERYREWLSDPYRDIQR